MYPSTPGILFSTSLFAQKFTVYGSVKDALTGENLIGAVVIIKETNQVVVANNYGFYSFLPVQENAQSCAVIWGIPYLQNLSELRKYQTGY